LRPRARLVDERGLNDRSFMSQFEVKERDD